MKTLKLWATACGLNISSQRIPVRRRFAAAAILVLALTTIAQITLPAQYTPGYLFSGFFGTKGQGIASGTYVSGITATGSATQTCVLTLFNGGNVAGQATVALSGTNAIASGTAFTNVVAGHGNTSASTSATAINGTATCSGTATVTTALTGGYSITLNAQAATNVTLFPAGTLHATQSVTIPASDIICAHAGDSINSLTCTNSSDATGAYQSFATTWSQPANFWYPGRWVQICGQFEQWSNATTAPTVLVQLAIGATQLYAPTGAMNNDPGTSGVGWTACWNMISATTAGSLFTQALPYTWPTFSTGNQPANIIAQPKAIGTAANTFSLGIEFSATGIKSGAYTSGITAVGTTGQTCILSTFNDDVSTAATATVALTSLNTIATSTPLVITNTGNRSSGASTSATASAGTASACSGTATVTTVLGGAQGNGAWLQSLTVTYLN